MGLWLLIYTFTPVLYFQTQITFALSGALDTHLTRDSLSSVHHSIKKQQNIKGLSPR